MSFIIPVTAGKGADDKLIQLSEKQVIALKHPPIPTPDAVNRTRIFIPKLSLFSAPSHERTDAATETNNVEIRARRRTSSIHSNDLYNL